MSKEISESRETFVGEHITGPFVDAVESVAGSILTFPLRVADKLIDKGIAGVRDFVKGAVSGIVGFPVKR